MPSAGISYCVIRPLTTTFVDVLTRVMELERIVANASGMSNLDGWILNRLDKPMVIGVKKADVAVFDMKELSTPAAPVMTQ